MLFPLKTLSLCLLAATGLAGCRPTYVQSSYYDDYSPAYAPGYGAMVAVREPVPVFISRPVVKVIKVVRVEPRPPRRPGQCNRQTENCRRHRHD